MARLNIIVDDDIYETLRKLSYMTRAPVAEIVRKALREYLAPIPEAKL